MAEEMSKVQLEKELRDIRTLVGACLGALVGFTSEKQGVYLQRSEDAEWFRRHFQYPRLWEVGVSVQACDTLRNFNSRPGEKGPRFGYLNLEEVAVAGRERIAAIPGIGDKTMAALDKAIVENGMEWASDEPVTV